MAEMIHQTTTQRRPDLPALDHKVTTRLRVVGARVRRYVLVEGLAWVMGFLLLGAGVQLALDYGTRGLRLSMRASLLGVIVIGVVWQVWKRLARPLRVRPQLWDVANLVERRYPELSSSLISAVRFARGEVGPAGINSPELVASVIADVGARSAKLDFNAVLDPRRVRQAVAALLVMAAVGTGATAASPEVVGLWFRRNVLLTNDPWPKQTHLIVDIEGDELIGARGDDLIIQAHAQGVQPREVDIVFETASGDRGREVMVTVGSQGSYRYRYTFKKAQEDFVFHLEGGDDRTEPIHARLLERPRVSESEMRITPPAYTRGDAVTLGDGERAAQALPGSTVTISVLTNKPVTQATLMAGRRKVAEAITADGRLVATFAPQETHTYHFALTDEVGLDNRRPVRFSLRVVPDEPPRARMKLPGVGDMITPDAVLPIEIECADTFGLASAELVYRVSREGADDVTIPLPTFKQHLTNFTTSISWPVATDNLVAGEVLTLWVRAADFNSVTGPGRAASPEVTLRVVTREELLEELSRREQEYRVEFERLIDSQERLRGSLLSIFGRFRENDRLDTLVTDLAQPERRQRNIAGSVNVIRQQFEQILASLVVNRLDNKEERERLGDQIITPLTQLAKRGLVAAADMIRQWSREATAEKADQIDPQQVAVLSQMRSVRDNMIQWEGYQEVVSMLRDIIRLQQELQNETRKALQDQASDVFDDK